MTHPNPEHMKRMGWKPGTIAQIVRDATEIKRGDRVNFVFPFEEMHPTMVLRIVNNGTGQLVELDTPDPISGKRTWLTCARNVQKV